jgi:hypothetical protein
MCLDHSFGERELKIQLMLESFEEGICSMTVHQDEQIAES